jgi:hypothetical protein
VALPKRVNPERDGVVYYLTPAGGLVIVCHRQAHVFEGGRWRRDDGLVITLTSRVWAERKFPAAFALDLFPRIDGE